MALFSKVNEWIPRRAVLGALIFLACLCSYITRTNMSIIIVAMVEPTGKDDDKGPECTIEAVQSNATSSLKDFGERYEWSRPIQGLLLSSYFFGVLPGSIPAGLLAEKFGGSKVVAFATLIPAVLNLLIPMASNAHYGVVFALRFITGFFGSAIYPALHAMIARWAPPSEKGMFIWAMQGGPFGTFVTFSVCGPIIVAYGWKAAYYITSAMILVFYGLWMIFAYDTPDQHPTITEQERTYIKEKIGSNISKQKPQLPLRAVATSVPFWTLLWAHFANMWGIYFISSSGPKYTLEVLGLDLKSGGFMTGLPYIARLGTGALFALAGDYIRRNEKLTVLWIRRVFMLFSHLLPGLCLIGMTYSGCDHTLSIIMLNLMLAFNGAACQTSLQNHQDLAPNFAGSLYGIMNTFGSFPGFIIPPIIGALTHETNGIVQWRAMFWISFAIFASSTVAFWLFGSASIQPWNNQSPAKTLEDPEEEKKMAIAAAPKEVQSEEEEEENAKL